MCIRDSLGLHTAIRKTAFLDSAAVTDIHTNMTVRTKRNARNLRQRINCSPGTALALCIGEHAVGGLVRTAVAAVLAGKGLVGADSFLDAYAAAGPVVALDETNAVSANLFLGNVILISGCAIGTVVRRVLICLAGTQGLSTLVDVE